MILLLIVRTATACKCDEGACGSLFLRGSELAANDVIAMLPDYGPSCSGEEGSALGAARLLQGEDEVAVEVTSDDEGIYRMIPAGGWVVGATYTILLGEGEEEEHTFSVEDAADDEASPAPQIERATREISTREEAAVSSCGGWDFIDVVLKDTAEEPVYFEIDQGNPRTIPLRALPFRDEITLRLGEEACYASEELANDAHSFQIRAVDAAGNASEWSERVTVHYPSGCGSGCAAGEGGAGGPLALLGLLARGRGARATMVGQGRARAAEER